MAQKSDFDRLEACLIGWIDGADYEKVYEKIHGKWAKGKAENIIKLIKETYKIKECN